MLVLLDMPWLKSNVPAIEYASLVVSGDAKEFWLWVSPLSKSSKISRMPLA